MQITWIHIDNNFRANLILPSNQSIETIRQLMDNKWDMIAWNNNSYIFTKFWRV